MDKKNIEKLSDLFEKNSYRKENTEYWFARDLQKLLDYSEWRNFLKIIEKAKIACKNSKQKITDHFVDINKMVNLGSGSEREIEDIMLTRYASYLIAQNGDSKKEIISFAQSYFAIQTRKQELIEERIRLIERMNAREKLIETETEFSKNLFERGVDNQGFARIRSKGDKALFGGNNTFEMKKRLNVPNSKPLADFLPIITIKAKDLATEVSNFNTKKKDLQGEKNITNEHINNNKDVRELLAKSDIKPEELPPEKDIKKLQKNILKEDKKRLTK